jgi:hypothetical protein
MEDDRKTIQSLRTDLQVAKEIISENFGPDQRKSNEDRNSRFESFIVETSEKTHNLEQTLLQLDTQKFTTHADVQAILTREVDKITQVIIPKIVNDSKESDSHFRDMFKSIIAEDRAEEDVEASTNVRPEDIRAIMQGLEKDLRKCHSTADVKTRILLTLQKFVLTGINISFLI